MEIEINIGGFALRGLTAINLLSGENATGLSVLVAELQETGRTVFTDADDCRHWKDVGDYWKDVVDVVEAGNEQVFVPIYSLDALYAAVNACADELDKLSMHRLEMTNDGSVTVKDFGGDMLQTALEMGLEVR